jgi:exo-beta-1,3-glucanase (GH17 family)
MAKKHIDLETDVLSSYYEHRMAFAGLDLAGRSVEDLAAIFREILNGKIHGLSFSPYTVGQGPGTVLTEAQIRDRLSIIEPYVHWIRSFSCTEGNERIPAIAHERGLKTMVGVWLDEDQDMNEKELAKGIELANAGHVDILTVGNEVLLHDTVSEEALIGYLDRARAACPGVEVGYVDAYFKFVHHPRVTEACTVVLANCYPFWEGCPCEFALPYMKEMYRQAVKVANGRKVIISETGWPNRGTAFEGAAPSDENALRYFINTYKWAEEEGIDVLYFAAFDEDWKVGKEGDVGAYWGLWDKDGNLKYV